MTQRLIYLANIRLPTEKAHGLQIMQNCEALADAGWDIRLWIAARRNTPDLRRTDPFTHYGVRRNFRLRALPTLDLLPLVPGRADALAKIVFGVQLVTWLISACIGVLLSSAEFYYSRDDRALLLLSLIRPRRQLVYEAHSLAKGRLGTWIQRRAVRRVGTILTTTALLREDLIAIGAPPARTFTAHDGIRGERFSDMPEQGEARRRLGWSPNAFIVGYVGRLQTMAMDKGVGTLVEALAKVEGASLAIVGGPEDAAEQLRAAWIARGLPPDHFLYTGQMPPDEVPLCLRAFDVCAMPFPATTHFARHASPIKLFEYMASGRALVATHLNSTAEIVTDGENGLLVPPSDPDALAAALIRLRDDPALRERLAQTAQAQVFERHTWAARAQTILNAIKAAP